MNNTELINYFSDKVDIYFDTDIAISNDMLTKEEVNFYADAEEYAYAKTVEYMEKHDYTDCMDPACEDDLDRIYERAYHEYVNACIAFANID